MRMVTCPSCDHCEDEILFCLNGAAYDFKCPECGREFFATSDNTQEFEAGNDLGD